MQPEGAICPEFDLDRVDTIASPMGRPGRIQPQADSLPCNLGHQPGPAFQRLALPRGPCPDTRLQGTRAVIGVGLRVLFPQFNRDVLRLDLAFPLETIAGAWAPRFSAEFGQAF